MKIDIDSFEDYATLGIFVPLIVLAIVIASPFALLGYIISKVFKLNK